MPDKDLLLQYQDKKRELAALVENFNSGEFLSDIIPPELHFAVQSCMQDIRDEMAKQTAEVNALFAKIKSDFVQEAVNKFSTSQQFDRRIVDGIKITARQCVTYNIDKVKSIAKEHGLVDKLTASGVFKTVMDEKKFASVVSQEQQALFSSAKEVKLKDVSVVDKNKDPQESSDE